MQVAIVFQMTSLTKDGKLGMRILGIMVEVSSGKPDGVRALLDLSPTFFPLLGTALLTGPACLFFACFGPFIPIGRIAFFVPWHSRKDVLLKRREMITAIILFASHSAFWTKKWFSSNVLS
jgi:hypothetical protein